MSRLIVEAKNYEVLFLRLEIELSVKLVDFTKAFPNYEAEDDYDGVSDRIMYKFETCRIELSILALL